LRKINGLENEIAGGNGINGIKFCPPDLGQLMVRIYKRAYSTILQRHVSATDLATGGREKCWNSTDVKNKKQSQQFGDELQSRHKGVMVTCASCALQVKMRLSDVVARDEIETFTVSSNHKHVLQLRPINSIKLCHQQLPSLKTKK